MSESTMAIKRMTFGEAGCAIAFAALAMVPQDPAAAQPAPQPPTDLVVTISDLKYVGGNGTAVVVPARNVVEIRLLEDRSDIRLELLYENGDYSLIDAQEFHLLRGGSAPREVRLVRGKTDQMRFPRLPTR